MTSLLSFLTNFHPSISHAPKCFITNGIVWMIEPSGNCCLSYFALFLSALLFAVAPSTPADVGKMSLTAPWVCLSVCLSVHIFLYNTLLQSMLKNQQVLRELGPKRSLTTIKSQTVDNKLTELMAPTESPLYWTLLIFCCNTLALHCCIVIGNCVLQ